MCVLSCIGCLGATAEPKPAISVDLLSRGMRPDFFAETTNSACRYQYLGYRSVQWLDEQRILAAYSTTPDCAQTEGVRAGNIRLATFDARGSCYIKLTLHMMAVVSASPHCNTMESGLDPKKV